MPDYALCRCLPPLLRVVFVRETAVIFFVLFCPCNRYLFLFRTYVVLLAVFPFGSSCIKFFRTPVVSFALLSFSFFLFSCHSFFMVWFVLLCSRTRYVSNFACSTLMNCDCCSAYSVSQPDHIITTRYLSRMKNQHGLWVCSCRWIERTNDLMPRQQTHIDETLFLFFFPSFVFAFFLTFSWSGLFCGVLVISPTWHASLFACFTLMKCYRLFGILCFTAVVCLTTECASL